MKEVLIVGCRPACNGGIEHFLVSLVNSMNNEDVAFSILVAENDYSEQFMKQFNDCNTRFYTYNNQCGFFSKLLNFYNAIKRIDFEIAHIQVTCGIRAIEGLICKMFKKKVIFHSHSNLPEKPLKYKVLVPLFSMIGDAFLACSQDAGRYFFGRTITSSDKFSVVHNAVDSNKFRYSEADRKFIRDMFNIDDSILLGFVGRLSVEKNILYALSIFEKFKEKHPNTKFMIVGDGSELGKIKDYCATNHFDNDVILVGNQKDVNKFMSAMDCLLLTSLFEALPVVLVESQAMQLVSFATKYVPDEIKISEYIHFFDINSEQSEISEMIWETLSNPLIRNGENDFVVKSFYDLSNCYYKVKHVYGIDM